MKKSKATILIIVALTGMLVGCDGNYIKVSGFPYSVLNGKKAKKSYQSYQVSGIASLNYLKTSAASDANHFTNFLDGLLTHSDFGSLELNLAESAKHNAEYTEFEFKVRHDDGCIWVQYDGTPYTVAGEKQYVTAEDFVTGAKTVCTFTTASDTFYLMSPFISGAVEYYLMTQIIDGQNQGIAEFTALTTNPLKANWLNTKIKNEYASVYRDGDYAARPIKGADIPNIENGSRFGVTANKETNTVTYTLMKPSSFFPTLLTYSCYLPVNANFLEEKGNSFGIAKKDSILYNGPFLLSELDETNIIYKKNEIYHTRADLHNYNTARVETIKYNIPKDNIDSTYSRSQYEAGNIDGFGLSQNDKVGWKKYVVGKKGTGTYDNPANGQVNSRFLDTIGSAYGSNIVLDRSANQNSYKSYSTFAGKDEAARKANVKNTEKALRLADVRKAIMGSIDYPTYYMRYADGDASSIFARQSLVHTYVPKNFVRDSNNNEYTETYFAAALAEKRGISLAEAQAIIEPGQWDTVQKSQEEVSALVQKALQAIQAYNADTELNEQFGGQISLPINIEYFSLWYDQEWYTYDSIMINELNKRLNGITEVAEDYSNCPYFKVIPTDEVTSKNYSTVDGQASKAAAFDFSVHMWGWGADYGDPLTYLNTYVIDGDWSSIFYYLNKSVKPQNITFNGTDFTVSDLLGHYTALVQDAQGEYENFAERYRKFAKAEVELIEDLAIYLPQTNDGQGWALSISKAAGYETPTSNYGLSNERMTGMWVLKSPLKGTERQKIRAEQEAAKQKYFETHDLYNIYSE